MSNLDDDITLDPKWQEEQTDRLIAFELLQRVLRADYHPIESAVLADKIGADKGLSYRIIDALQSSINAKHRPI